MKRLRFLDWMRGLAVLLMIQCHTFNSLAREELRSSGPYVLSQVLGGMAAPLFLFMSGITLAFQMDGFDRRVADIPERWLKSVRRAAYILAIAFAFRFTNWLASQPHVDIHELTRVDILNAMGLALAVLSACALVPGKFRPLVAAGMGLAIAVAAPVVSNLNWTRTPAVIREYLVPVPSMGNFAFFPGAAYVAFGVALGALMRRAAAKLNALTLWSIFAGLVLVLTARYVSNARFSIYPHSDFWLDSPGLIFIRTGISLVILSSAWLWTEYCVWPRWSWVETLGRNSLMVYCVHIALVYGDLSKPLRGRVSLSVTALLCLLLVVLMVCLSAMWLRRKAQREAKWRAATTVATGSPQPANAY